MGDVDSTSGKTTAKRAVWWTLRPIRLGPKLIILISMISIGLFFVIRYFGNDTYAGAAIAIGSLLLALIQTDISLRQGIEQEKALQKQAEGLQKQSDDLQRQSDDLKVIAASVSTRYIGVFPDTIPMVCSIIDAANSSLLIVCDFPAYGWWSRHSLYAQYFAALANYRKRAPADSLTLVAYSEELRKRALESQFGVLPSQDGENPFTHLEHGNARRPSEEVMKGIEESDTYKARFSDRTSGDRPTTWNEFSEYLEQSDRAFLDQLVRGLEFDSNAIKVTMSYLPFFAWIADDRKALISFYTYGSEGREVSFETNDTKLVDIFREQAKKIHDAGRPSSGYRKGEGAAVQP